MAASIRTQRLHLLLEVELVHLLHLVIWVHLHVVPRMIFAVTHDYY